MVGLGFSVVLVVSLGGFRIVVLMRWIGCSSVFWGVDCGGFLLVGCGGFSWLFLVFWVVVFVGFVACLRDVGVIVFCLLVPL